MQKKLPPALDELNGSVVLFAGDTTPADCNSAAEEFIGYSREAFVDLSLSDLIAPHSDLTLDEVSEYITDAADGSTHSFDWQIQRGNGEPRWIELSLSPLTLEDTQYVLGECRDLTSYKARGQRIQLLYRVLRHNLRNEMNVILGHAEDLERAIAEDNLEEQAEIIKQTADDVASLSTTVGDLERLVENDATEREPVNVVEMTRKVAAELQDEYPEGTIKVDYREEMEEVVVSADEGLRLALEHALTNAIEHNDDASPSVTVNLETTPREAHIQIRDNGPGIPEIEIKSIQNDTTKVEHGGGLGLAIIQWCTRSLGGNFTITADGDGTTLSIQLPRLE